MLATPEFMRKNANLYLAGPRMRKSARYADRVYDKMVDAGTILQREGPRSANPLGFWKKLVAPFFPPQTWKICATFSIWHLEVKIHLKLQNMYFM